MTHAAPSSRATARSATRGAGSLGIRPTKAGDPAGSLVRGRRPPGRPGWRNFAAAPPSSSVMLLQRSNLAVVPAYNEEASVAEVVATLRAQRPDYDVLVVDDGSTRAPGARARRAGRAVVRLPYNLGIGGAVQTGFTYALEHGYERMVQV